MNFLNSIIFTFLISSLVPLVYFSHLFHFSNPFHFSPFLTFVIFHFPHSFHFAHISTFLVFSFFSHFSQFRHLIQNIGFCFKLATGFDVIFRIQNVEFPNGKTNIFAFRKPRSENVCPVDSSASLFRHLVWKSLIFAVN